jgi:hypothetical protein
MFQIYDVNYDRVEKAPEVKRLATSSVVDMTGSL